MQERYVKLHKTPQQHRGNRGNNQKQSRWRYDEEDDVYEMQLCLLFKFSWFSELENENNLEKYSLSAEK